MSSSVDNERLAAYVDGELIPDERAAVEHHLAKSPEDRAVVDRLRQLNAYLGIAYEAPYREGLPAGIRVAVTGGAARRQRAWVAGAALALAACIVGAAMAFVLRPAAQDIVPGPVHTGSALHALLESEPSGSSASTDGGTATLMSTFLDRQGQPCREIEIVDGGTAMTRAVACRGNGVWTISATVSQVDEPARERDSFMPAAGAQNAAFDAALDSIGAGPVLGPSEEEDLIGEAWRRPQDLE